MLRSKIFFGNASSTTAAEKMNKWLEENPEVRIAKFRYSQATPGDHSICILYYEGERSALAS